MYRLSTHTSHNCLWYLRQYSNIFSPLSKSHFSTAIRKEKKKLSSSVPANFILPFGLYILYCVCVFIVLLFGLIGCCNRYWLQLGTGRANSRSRLGRVGFHIGTYLYCLLLPIDLMDWAWTFSHTKCRISQCSLICIFFASLCRVLHICRNSSRTLGVPRLWLLLCSQSVEIFY